jgi:lysophospholipase L1-like esterase
MIYSNEELKKYYKGAYSFKEKDGWLQSFQYTGAQMEYFKRTEIYWYERSFASTGKTIEAVTSATEVSFDYKIIWQGSLDTFELFVNGEPAEAYYIENLEREGRLTFHVPEGGSEKRIIIYLPIDATVLVRNLEANAELIPIKPRKKVLWMGDSITQGYGPLRSAYTYVSVANRILDFDIINQGIGGYIYDKGSVMPMEGYRPDEIIVSLGTNQYMSGDIRPVKEFYERLTEVYGCEIPVTVISPVWRMDFDSEREEIDFIRFCEEIKKVCGGYPNIRVIDGFELVPHEHEYYIDDLHPNLKGAEIYGNKLAELF